LENLVGANIKEERIKIPTKEKMKKENVCRLLNNFEDPPN